MSEKIAIYNLNTYPEMSGGSERSCIELAKALSVKNKDVTVVSLNAFREGFNKFNFDGVEIYKLPLLNLYWPTTKKKRSFFVKALWNVIDIANIPMALLLCFWLKKRKFDVVHTNNIKGVSPWIFPMLKLFGFKIVHTTRDYYLLDSGAWYRDLSSEHNTLLLKLKRINKYWCSNFVDYAVFNSKYMRDYHAECGFFKYSQKKVIYNGFNSATYTNNEKEKKPIRNFGYIGRLSKEKGIDGLFDGFIKFKNNEYKLIIAGASYEDFLSLYPEYEKTLKERYDIDFIGVVDNIEFYKKVDCVIVPSKYNEPFGRVAMEAIFMGKAVIVSDKGGLPEQILPGVRGAICKDDDYYNAMKKIIEEDEQLLSHSTPNLKQFTMEFCAEEYFSIYREKN